ncbi:Basal-body rod modification protein FlgD [wastewater metagenome]|uniref:Basal-body rod modification protein FlgD n=2 Tax=unclassified sequences TaxID=12908 RepID=A0A5B8R771_9ZZZZ|nr:MULTISPECIES: flagellar hook assembly protein FlgD [Arhodomonas]MCS4502815.1 flagellar hook assembly protein FlgD [Arhodomonas aquaeolei]QEA03703.1 basal-body rod modification protein FlgD [uncultured organism]
MTTVTGTSSASQQAAMSSSQAENDRTELGQQDFLKLMTTQLQNQDPMNPMENAEFMSQMAQFTSASGIQSLQSSFSDFQSSMTASQSLQAAGLVGRKVTAESDTGHLPQDGELSGTVELDAGVGNLTVSIVDGTGTRVAEMALGAQDAGSVDFSWDGENANGERLPSGDYQVVAETTTTDGVTTQPVRIAGEVTSVALAGNGRTPTLTVDGVGDISLSDVRKVQ